MDEKKMERLLPHQISFEPTQILAGSTYQQILALDIPAKNPDPFWLGELSQEKDINMTVEIVENSTFKSNISDTVMNLQRNIVEESEKNKPDQLKLKRLESRLQTANEVLNKINSEKQLTYHILLLVQIFASSERMLLKKSNRIINLFSRKSMIISVAGRLQKEGFRKLLGATDDKNSFLKYSFSQEGLSETISSSYPFAASNLNDGTGLPLGQDSLGNYCMIDFWARKHGRTNNSIIITGLSGKGKSTFVKRLLGYEVAKGTKVLILDPEREFNLIQESFPNKSTTLDMGNGQKDSLNVLDVNVDGAISLMVSDEELEKYTFPQDYDKLNITSAKLVEYQIEAVMDFLILILGKPNAGDQEELHKSFLRDALRQVFKDKGFMDIPISELAKMSAEDMPLLSGALSVLQNMVENSVHDSHKKIILDIVQKLSSILKGSQGDLWDQPTNVAIEGKDIIIFDMKSLDGVSETTKIAQYTNILNFAWNLVSKDKKEDVILVIDEGHMLIDPRLKEIVRRLKEYQKRIRKYQGALVIATQNLADYRHPEIKGESEAILSNPSYKIFFGADGTEIKVMSEIYDLTKKEKQILKHAGRGEIIILAGNTKTHIPKVDLFDFEDEKLLGDTGGR